MFLTEERPFLALILALGFITQGCGEHLASIRPPVPGAPTVQLKCGIASTSRVMREQAFCIARLAGLKRGIRRWGFREYSDYVDVYNTTSNGPPEKGLNVRIATPGGQVIGIEPWEEIQLHGAKVKSSLRNVSLDRPQLASPIAPLGSSPQVPDCLLSQRQGIYRPECHTGRPRLPPKAASVERTGVLRRSGLL